MLATIEIYKDGCLSSVPIVLAKEHDDLHVLRKWLDSIANKQGNEAFIIGGIDNGEAFIRGSGASINCETI